MQSYGNNAEVLRQGNPLDRETTTRRLHFWLEFFALWRGKGTPNGEMPADPDLDLSDAKSIEVYLRKHFGEYEESSRLHTLEHCAGCGESLFLTLEALRGAGAPDYEPPRRITFICPRCGIIPENMCPSPFLVRARWADGTFIPVPRTPRPDRQESRSEVFPRSDSEGAQ